MLWNDIDWPDAGRAPGPHSIEALLGHYRATVPEGIVNDRWGADVWDYRTSEYDAHTQHEAAPGWEHCRGLGFSFGYNRVEDESLTLSPRELARHYADVVSRGGRLLLNVGPTAAGEIPPVQRRTLEGAASWLVAIKPHTIGRGPVAEGDVEVSGCRVVARLGHARRHSSSDRRARGIRSLARWTPGRGRAAARLTRRRAASTVVCSFV